MFAPQDEIRVQLPEEMRGVVEKLRSSGFSLGTVSALELISWSGAPRADVPPRARLLTVTLEGASALEAFVRDLELSLTPQEAASIRGPGMRPARRIIAKQIFQEIFDAFPFSADAEADGKQAA